MQEGFPDSGIAGKACAPLTRCPDSSLVPRSWSMKTMWLRDDCSFMAVAPTDRCRIARSSNCHRPATTEPPRRVMSIDCMLALTWRHGWHVKHVYSQISGLCRWCGLILGPWWGSDAHLLDARRLADVSGFKERHRGIALVIMRHLRHPR